MKTNTFTGSLSGRTVKTYKENVSLLSKLTNYSKYVFLRRRGLLMTFRSVYSLGRQKITACILYSIKGVIHIFLLFNSSEWSHIDLFVTRSHT